MEAQVTFVEDWRWVTGHVLELNWIPEKASEGNVLALCLPTGPADQFETGTLLMLDLIHASRKSLWIASPYFVPDAQFVSALQLAALRGVDVRILIPENNDNQFPVLLPVSDLRISPIHRCARIRGASRLPIRPPLVARRSRKSRGGNCVLQRTDS